MFYGYGRNNSLCRYENNNYYILYLKALITVFSILRVLEHSYPLKLDMCDSLVKFSLSHQPI